MESHYFSKNLPIFFTKIFLLQGLADLKLIRFKGSFCVFMTPLADYSQVWSRLHVPINLSYYWKIESDI